MTPWNQITPIMRVLIVALFAGFAWRIFLAPEGSRLDLLLIGLFLFVWGYFFFGFDGVRQRWRKAREDAKKRQPVLAEEPMFVPADALPPGEEFGVYDIETGDALGNLPRTQLEALIRFHEDCGLETNDFFVMHETPEFMSEQGQLPALVETLKNWLNDRDSMELRWSTKTVDH